MRKMNGTNTTPTAAKNVQIELNGEIQTVRSFKPFKNGSNLGSITTVRWEFAVLFVGFVLLIICPVISFASRDTNEITGHIINNTNPTNITANSHLTVVMLPKLDPFLKGLNDLTVWISPLSSIWTFLAAVGVVLVPFILRMYNKNQNKKNKYKKIDDFSSDD